MYTFAKGVRLCTRKNVFVMKRTTKDENVHRKKMRENTNFINWYPNHDTSRFRKKLPTRKLPMPEKPETLTCPVCIGRGRRIDAKTKHMRDCVACKGEGRVRM